MFFCISHAFIFKSSQGPHVLSDFFMVFVIPIDISEDTMHIILDGCLGFSTIW